MKGHIRKRGKSSWALVIFLGRDAGGKQHRRLHAVRGTRRDAQRELARLMNEINTGAYVEPAHMTVGEFLDRWMTHYAKPKVLIENLGALSGDDRRLNRTHAELGDNVPVAPWSQYVRTAGDHTAKLTHVWALLHGSRQYGTSAISCCCERGRRNYQGGPNVNASPSTSVGI
jgi:hypothetical protein